MLPLARASGVKMFSILNVFLFFLELNSCCSSQILLHWLLCFWWLYFF